MLNFLKQFFSTPSIHPATTLEEKAEALDRHFPEFSVFARDLDGYFFTKSKPKSHIKTNHQHYAYTDRKSCGTRGIYQNSYLYALDKICINSTFELNGSDSFSIISTDCSYEATISNTFEYFKQHLAKEPQLREM